MPSRRAKLRVAVYNSAASPSKTLEAELRDLEDAAAQRGWEIVQGYADKFRATDPQPFAHPALERLLTDASKGRFSVVLVPL